MKTKMLTSIVVALTLTTSLIAVPPAIPSRTYYSGGMVPSFNQRFSQNNNYNYRSYQPFQNYREYSPVRSAPNIFNGRNYDNGWQSQSNIYGGYNWYKRY